MSLDFLANELERRRIVVCYFPVELLTGLLTGGFPAGQLLRVETGDIPAVARCVGCGYDEKRNAVWMQFEHPSFPETPAGQPLERRFGAKYTVADGRSIVADVARAFGVTLGESQGGA